MKRFGKISILTGLLAVFLYPVSVSAEEMSFVTINAWSGIDYKGFFSCGEFESLNDRSFRQEVLFSSLKAVDADVIVLNGLNPVEKVSAAAAEQLGMNRITGLSRSGFRIGPVSLPVNLKEGDAVLTSTELETEQAGRLHMNGAVSTQAVTLFSRDGVQVIGCRIIKGDASFYLFSVLWTESLFSSASSLDKITAGYLNGFISPEDYTKMIENAVNGSEIRLAQAEETLSFINSTAGESPVVLMGSLNALPESEELLIMKNAGFTDVFEKSGRGYGYTIDTEKNNTYKKIAEDDFETILPGKYRADYIMIRGAELLPVSAEVVLDSPVYGVYPSKRFGVKAVINLLPTNPSE